MAQDGSGGMWEQPASYESRHRYNTNYNNYYNEDQEEDDGEEETIDNNEEEITDEDEPKLLYKTKTRHSTNDEFLNDLLKHVSSLENEIRLLRRKVLGIEACRTDLITQAVENYFNQKSFKLQAEDSVSVQREIKTSGIKCSVVPLNRSKKETLDMAKIRPQTSQYEYTNLIQNVETVQDIPSSDSDESYKPYKNKKGQKRNSTSSHKPGPKSKKSKEENDHNESIISGVDVDAVLIPDSDHSDNDYNQKNNISTSASFNSNENEVKVVTNVLEFTFTPDEFEQFWDYDNDIPLKARWSGALTALIQENGFPKCMFNCKNTKRNGGKVILNGSCRKRNEECKLRFRFSFLEGLTRTSLVHATLNIEGMLGHNGIITPRATSKSSKSKSKQKIIPPRNESQIDKKPQPVVFSPKDWADVFDMQTHRIRSGFKKMMDDVLVDNGYGDCSFKTKYKLVGIGDEEKDDLSVIGHCVGNHKTPSPCKMRFDLIVAKFPKAFGQSIEAKFYASGHLPGPVNENSSVQNVQKREPQKEFEAEEFSEKDNINDEDSN